MNRILLISLGLAVSAAAAEVERDMIGLDFQVPTVGSPVVGFAGKKKIDHHDDHAIDWFIAFVRGSWFGFTEGFWHGKMHLSTYCIAEDHVKPQIFAILDFLAYGTLAELINVADDITYLYYENWYRCRFMAPIWHIGRWCRVKDHCDFGTLLVNLFETHVVETMGSMSMIAANSLELSFEADSITIHDQFYTYGKNIGSLVANLFDIHKLDREDRDEETPEK